MLEAAALAREAGRDDLLSFPRTRPNCRGAIISPTALMSLKSKSTRKPVSPRL